jgi:hypothetical protein
MNADKAINKVIAQKFSRPDPAVVVRKTLTTLVFTGLLAFAAYSLDGPLALALWAWVVLRLGVFLFLPLASKEIDERMRRLEALPPQYLQLLRTGKP